MREDVRRVGHAQSQHAAAVGGEHGGEISEQSGDVRAEVDAVRAGVLRGQPDLRDALRDCGLHALYERLGRVAPQLAPRVLGLAVGALPEAPGGEGQNLDVLVPAHLGQVERRQGFLLQQPHGVARERALHNIHDAIDLSHADEG